MTSIVSFFIEGHSRLVFCDSEDVKELVGCCVMVHRPVVSVIIAAYNAEKYIERSVKSALEQTVNDVEVIVVDDASTDATMEKVRSISDHRIRMFTNAFNSGPAYSRNIGIREARGDWLAVLDADDWWKPDRLEVLVNYGINHCAHIVCDDLFLIENETTSPWNTYLQSREKVLGTITEAFTIDPLQMIREDYGVLQPVVRTDFLRKYSITYKDGHNYGEDFVFLLDCLLSKAKMILLPVPYYFYRCGHDSLSNSMANPVGQCRLLEELLSSAPYNEAPAIKKALQARLRKKRLILQELRANRFFSNREVLRGVATLLRNPPLLVEYAKMVKRKIVS